ncbi:MAG: PIN domain-containing protein [Bacteroidales bacterium]|nr:PIN domain-containing protein [Bacteroidales bacterium]MCF8455743.1 PIN domain-containing protein [Bacteroidales bacterium]
MQIVDANVILRYFLNDNEAMFANSVQIIENNSIFIPFEVAAEVVYVLEKVYEVPRNEISQSLRNLIANPDISLNDKDVFIHALQIYEEKKIDFVDTLLIAYNHIKKHKIHTFDKQLQKLLI